MELRKGLSRRTHFNIQTTYYVKFNALKEFSTEQHLKKKNHLSYNVSQWEMRQIKLLNHTALFIQQVRKCILC